MRAARRPPGPVRALAVVVAILAAGLLPPATALACPACAMRDSAGAAVFAWVGLMIGIPYVIAAVMLRVIRNLERGS